ncbi:MAG: class I SAM-dependent methyltransferase [Syntrophales bacterium]|jgi:ubiquinone/menaquinone biosynthesis C-methylase UbiE
MREYQCGYSNKCGAMYDVSNRERKAQTMVTVFEDFFKSSLHDLCLLNVGGSAGIIDNYLSDHFGSVVGVDIDEPAIAHAQNTYQKENLRFCIGDALNLEFSDNTFDVVVCSQVYEHVPDAKKMMGEIFRVLVPNGVCYFAAGNRLMWNEQHYNLPLLSVIPRPLAHVYVRLMKKASHYHELHYTYWGLRKLVRPFVVHDYTLKMVCDPDKYSIAYMIPPDSTKASIARFIIRYFLWLSPGYIWLLEKPNNVLQPIA